MSWNEWGKTRDDSWVSQAGLSLRNFTSYATELPTSTPDQTSYYYAPMKLTDLGIHHLDSLDLGISGVRAQAGEVFWLCDMTAWAAYCKVPSAWCAVLTTALGVMENQQYGEILKPDTERMKAVLNPLGVATPWSGTLAFREIRETLRTHFPLASSKGWVENRSFATLAGNRHYHLSALVYYFSTLMHQDDYIPY